MSSARVTVKGVPMTDQFKTNWSQFMKNNLSMNIMVYPVDPQMDKSSAEITFTPAIPKPMIDKGQSTDSCWTCLCFKDDTNSWQAIVTEQQFSDYDTAIVVGESDFMATAGDTTFPITAAKVTVGNKYDIHIAYSKDKISLETIEVDSKDVPYIAYGKASEYVVEVTCIA